MTGPGYLTGITLWLALWASAFSVSALFVRLRLHGTTRGDVLLIARDLTWGALAVGGWLWLGRGSLGGLTALAGLLAVLAGAATGVYLWLVARHGIRRIKTATMYRQRHPLIPLRILSFVVFQQVAATLLLLDWNRRFAAEGPTLCRTALIFGLTHLGVAGFGLPLRHAALLTVTSAGAMLLWGALRLYGQDFWAPPLSHYLFYITLACWSVSARR